VTDCFAGARNDSQESVRDDDLFFKSLRGIVKKFRLFGFTDDKNAMFISKFKVY